MPLLLLLLLLLLLGLVAWRAVQRHNLCSKFGRLSTASDKYHPPKGWHFPPCVGPAT